MKKGFWKLFKQIIFRILPLAIASQWLISCHEDYKLDENEPQWLGASIYDYLKENGNYTYEIRLIDDVEDYKLILSKTGSKTLFVAKDSAFERFFANNSWGVTRYEDLTMGQKKILLKFSMIDNAYLIETLANYNNGSLIYGTALRRKSSVSVLDNFSLLSGDKLPEGKWWDRYRSNGMYLLQDASEWCLVYFLQSTLENDAISDEDFNLITGTTRSAKDAHIFNIKVVERDITCKNGYVHVLQDVLVPPVNMAQYLYENSNTKIFSSLLEKFSAPYYNSNMTEKYNQKNLDNPIDSIFEKIYFSAIGGKIVYPDGQDISSELWLPFNPGWNSYASSSALQADMATVLAPTDAAMTKYLEGGSGAVLKERYGNWDNVPLDIVALFLKRHLRTSFLGTLPSVFNKLIDTENSPLVASSDDIISSYIGLNGVVYETNKVYPPDDYVSVYGPVLFSDKTKVFNWAIRQKDFRLYLNSLISTYSFFVPVDEFFKNYIDPIAYAKDVKAALKYWYYDKYSTVVATVYSYDATTGTVGDSIGFIGNSSFISARLLDLIDSHIVVGDVESGSRYYLAKNGNMLKIEGKGQDLKVQGGYDIKSGVSASVISGGVYKQTNGTTYFINKPIQTPLQSVYKVLSGTPEFNAFFKLLDGFSGTDYEVFVKKTNYYGIDYNIKFFNTFNYTVYVPTNEAIQQAITDGLISDWDKINSIADTDEKNIEIEKLLRFLRYHFQDNAVLISGVAIDKVYQTATIKTDNVETKFRTYKDKYYKLGVTGDGESLNLSTENYGSASVVKENGLYNIMTRDYIFSGDPQAYKEINGTGAGNEFSSISITTSSTAVIHQINNVLRFE
jgi:uncharacterized surface protein with fasciclin (FAS1) repeats